MQARGPSPRRDVRSVEREGQALAPTTSEPTHRVSCEPQGCQRRQQGRCLGANWMVSDPPRKTYLEKPNWPLEKRPKHLMNM